MDQGFGAMSDNSERIDPICGMVGDIPAYGRYFCSLSCAEKYRKQEGLPQEDLSACEEGEVCTDSCCGGKAVHWYQDKLFLVITGLAIILLAQWLLHALGFTFLDRFVQAFYQYTRMVWLAIAAGLLLGGLIDYFIPREYVVKGLGRHKKRTILYAVGFGFLMTACSHGILAIAIELYKKGASTAAVVSFLLAAPWANLPITILLFSFFGFKAILFVICALALAVITGLIYQVLDRHKMVECLHCDTPSNYNFSILADIKKRIREVNITPDTLKGAVLGVLEGSWDLSRMVLWWIVIGMVMASLAQAYIPHNFFMSYMGPNLLGLVVTLVFATILEICSEGTAPLAFEIYRQTGAFGNAFVFLMAGVATDYTEIGLIWANIGKKAALWMPLINVPMIIILGYLFNLLF